VFNGFNKKRGAFGISWGSEGAFVHWRGDRRRPIECRVCVKAPFALRRGIKIQVSTSNLPEARPFLI
jgi:hypothetical protein